MQFFLFFNRRRRLWQILSLYSVQPSVVTLKSRSWSSGRSTIISIVVRLSIRWMGSVDEIDFGPLRRIGLRLRASSVRKTQCYIGSRGIMWIHIWGFPGGTGARLTFCSCVASFTISPFFQYCRELFAGDFAVFVEMTMRVKLKYYVAAINCQRCSQ